MDDVELKPCPFCGEEDIRSSLGCDDDGTYTENDEVWGLYCSNCDVEFHTFHSRKEVIEKWNRRIGELDEC
jgi:restriction alleviation protein, Lar family